MPIVSKLKIVSDETEYDLVGKWLSYNAIYWAIVVRGVQLEDPFHMKITLQTGVHVMAGILNLDDENEVVYVDFKGETLVPVPIVGHGLTDRSYGNVEDVPAGKKAVRRPE